MIHRIGTLTAVALASFWTVGAAHAATQPLSLEQQGGFTPEVLVGDTIKININLIIDDNKPLELLQLIPRASGTFDNLTDSSFTRGSLLPSGANFTVLDVGAGVFNIQSSGESFSGTGTFAVIEWVPDSVGTGTILVQPGQFAPFSSNPNLNSASLTYTVKQKVEEVIIPTPTAAAAGLVGLACVVLRRRAQRTV